MTTNPQHPLPPPAYPAPPAIARVEGFAVASLVLGIVWVYSIGSILAIVFGTVALRRIKESNGWRTGKGMAVAGLVLGLVGVAMVVVAIVVSLAQSA